MSNNFYAELQRHNLLQTLFRHRVIANAVAEEAVDSETIEQAWKQLIEKRGLDSEDAMNRFLLDHGLTQENLAWQVALPCKIRAHCEAHYRHKAEAHFLSRKNQLDRIVYSLLRVKDPYLAQELYLRIEAREASFADLAAIYAEGPEKTTNGIVGPVPLTKAHPLLAEKLRISEEGILLSPFQISEWWLVTRLESYTPACFDEATAEKMSEELFNQWVNEETSRMILQFSTEGFISA